MQTTHFSSHCLFKGTLFSNHGALVTAIILRRGIDVDGAQVTLSLGDDGNGNDDDGECGEEKRKGKEK